MCVPHTMVPFVSSPMCFSLGHVDTPHYQCLLMVSLTSTKHIYRVDVHLQVSSAFRVGSNTLF